MNRSTVFLIVFSLFSGSVFSQSRSATFRPADSLVFKTYESPVGIVFHGTGVTCRYNGVQYNGIILKNRDIDENGVSGFVLTDTIAITMKNNKVKKLWLFKYRRSNGNKHVFRTHGLVEGTLEIDKGLIKGFIAFPKGW